MLTVSHYRWGCCDGLVYLGGRKGFTSCGMAGGRPIGCYVHTKDEDKDRTVKSSDANEE